MPLTAALFVTAMINKPVFRPHVGGLDASGREHDMGVSENRGDSRILIISPQNKVPLIFGNSHMDSRDSGAGFASFKAGFYVRQLQVAEPVPDTSRMKRVHCTIHAGSSHM